MPSPQMPFQTFARVHSTPSATCGTEQLSSAQLWPFPGTPTQQYDPTEPRGPTNRLSSSARLVSPCCSPPFLAFTRLGALLAARPAPAGRGVPGLAPVHFPLPPLQHPAELACFCFAFGSVLLPRIFSSCTMPEVFEGVQEVHPSFLVPFWVFLAFHHSCCHRTVG